MAEQVRNAPNQQLMLNQMVGNNPYLPQAMELIKQHNGNGEQAFYDYAKSLGMDPQQILNMLR